MRKIVLAGGSGQVGSLLRRHFVSSGDQVTVLTRSTASGSGFIQWDGRTPGSWVRELEGADLVVNLCGRSVNCRYNARNRYAILASRVHATRVLGEAMARAENPPLVWMNASTATIYRHSLDRDMDEQTGELGGNELDAPETWRFSIDVARNWEEAFADAPVPGTRKIALRSAMTMSPDRGGIFDTLLGLVRGGFGGRQGNGRQFVSWIHEADFVAAIEFLLADPSFEGPVNLAAPNPLPNREFMEVLRKAWGISFGIPSTRWMLELGALALRTETELILKSRRVVPGRLLQAGFAFQFSAWPAAAEDLVRRWREGATTKHSGALHPVSRLL
jgi:uncharacterized protein (TIGR01777 family)